MAYERNKLLLNRREAAPCCICEAKGKTIVYRSADLTSQLDICEKCLREGLDIIRFLKKRN